MQESDELMRGGQKPSVIPLALVEMIDRLDIEEKRTLVSLLDWDTLLPLRDKAVSPIRRVGDPRIYVGATESGLGLELPIEYVPAFLSMLLPFLSIQHVEILVQNSQGSEEYSCTAADLEDWLTYHPKAWQEKAMIIELGPHTLVSGGGGCLSLTLENVPLVIHREIAQRTLQLCGYDHTFKRDRFAAIVWNDQLEVIE